MYVDAFWLGVLTTVFVELAIIFLVALFKGGRR